MAIVSSYRDIANPDAVHFPGSFASRTRLSVAALACLVTILAVHFSGQRSLWQEGLLLAVALVVAVAWPRRITVDQYGVHRVRFLRRPVFIRHQDLAPAQHSTELPFLRRIPGLGSQGATVLLRSRTSRKRIVHTPRHADRDRFLGELRRHGADLSALA